MQSIRDLLDADAMALVVKERELRTALARLNTPPKLVVTDSQAFLKVAADTPLDVPMTSFSILFARFKGDLTAQVEGALALENLRPGDRILIAESCSHHPIADDIGRVKIPRWLNQYVGGKLEVDTVQGHDFPEDLSPLQRWWSTAAPAPRTAGRCSPASCAASRPGVPITNYGLAIAYSLGIFERALQPFPAALDIVRAAGRPSAIKPLSMAGGRSMSADRRRAVTTPAPSRAAAGASAPAPPPRPIPRRDPRLAARDRPRAPGDPLAAGRRAPAAPTWATRCICAGSSRSPTTASASAATAACAAATGPSSATA